MTHTSDTPLSGYILQQVYANNLEFIGVPADDLKADQPDITVEWDWDTADEGAFRVTLGINVQPSRDRPESVRARLHAVFQCVGEHQSLPLLDFVHDNAPALLVPFVREAIASLTSRGLHGALLLPPVNMVAVMQNMDPMSATGVRQLAERPDLARAFGVDVAKLERSEAGVLPR